MGFQISPFLLYRLLKDLDPNHTNQIAKIPFYAWFYTNIPDLERAENEGHVTFENALLDAKKERKRVQSEEQQMMNRIQYLRLQEKRILKGVEKVKKCTQQMRENQKEKEAWKKRKHAFIQELEAIRMELIGRKETAILAARHRRERNERQRLALRAQSVKRTRAERAENTQIIQSQAELDLECLRARSQALRTREKRSLEKREIHKGKSEQYVGDVWKQRLEMEEKERVISMRRMKELEAEEARLIQDLQMSQEMQQVALDTLEWTMQEKI